jgi:hypothetical protein
MTQMIDEKRWLNEEAEVKHLLSLLEIYSQNYRLAKEQYSMWGKGLVPPIVVHNLTEAEDGIAITTKKLQVVLSKIYAKDVVAPEVDEA